MKKIRALVLVHSTLVPPDSLKGSTEKEIEEWRTEYDVISHLKKAGHEVMPLGLSDSLSELRRAITEWKPGIVFNLLEEFDGIVTYDQHVVAFLELMHQPYTGLQSARHAACRATRCSRSSCCPIIACPRRSSWCSRAARRRESRRNCAFRCS